MKVWNSFFFSACFFALSFDIDPPINSLGSNNAGNNLLIGNVKIIENLFVSTNKFFKLNFLYIILSISISFRLKSICVFFI